MKDAPLVRLEGVSRFYGNVAAADNINLDIAQGEFLVLLGPSGSGKTTILSMIGGFVLPSAGKVFIRGKEMTHTPPAFRPTVTVFQDYALFPHMTVLDNVSFGLAMRKVPKNDRIKRAEESLETVGLKGFGARNIDQLSGGQRQRVALARALTVEPAVLLLDEPLGALDLKIRQQMQIELVHLQKNLNATFVHVTHDQEEAMSIADNIALINSGKIEDYGPPERIYLRPATLFAARFMGESNIIPAKVLARQGSRVTLKTRFGEFNLLGDFEPDSTCNLVLRPEQIKVGKEAVSGKAIVLGESKVTDVTFQGAHKVVHVCAGEDLDIDLQLRVPPDLGIAEGDMLNLHALESDGVLLSDSP